MEYLGWLEAIFEDKGGMDILHILSQDIIYSCGQQSVYVMSKEARLQSLSPLKTAVLLVQNEHLELAGLYGKAHRSVLCANNK